MEDKRQSVMLNEGIDKSKGHLIEFVDDNNVPGEK